MWITSPGLKDRIKNIVFRQEKRTAWQFPLWSRKKLCKSAVKCGCYSHPSSLSSSLSRRDNDREERLNVNQLANLFHHLFNSISLTAWHILFPLHSNFLSLSLTSVTCFHHARYHHHRRHVDDYPNHSGSETWWLPVSQDGEKGAMYIVIAWSSTTRKILA